MAEPRKSRVPKVSVVIPVYNEEESLPGLFTRLYPAMDALGRSYECVFVDDGSADRSTALLREQFEKRPVVTRVVLLQSNFGQHAAILAGFSASRGEAVITLDADLQNPPEEVGNLLLKMDEGYDYLGTIRRKRQDSAWRKLASHMMNHLRERITKVRM
ncbi:MAG: glycosyltransferase family 2 protein, partial [Gammaproteobacteria bacterium]